MKEQFLPYNLALELKELGFNEDCLAFYSAYPKEERKFMIVSEFRASKKLFLKNDYGLNTVTAPLWQQAFNFLWNKTGKYLIPIKTDEDTWLGLGTHYRTYEEARLVCLKKLIEICKNK